MVELRTFNPRVAGSIPAPPTIQEYTMKQTYCVTGVDVYGRRFKITTTNYIHAMGINLWQGSRWLVLPSGKKKLIVRVYN